MTGLWFLDLMLEHMMPICCWKYFGAVTSSFATPEHFLSKSAKKGPFSISIFFSTFYFELMIFIPMIIYIKGYKKMIWLFGKKKIFSSYEFFSVFITFFIFFFPQIYFSKLFLGKNITFQIIFTFFHVSLHNTENFIKIGWKM